MLSYYKLPLVFSIRGSVLVLEGKDSCVSLSNGDPPILKLNGLSLATLSPRVSLISCHFYMFLLPFPSYVVRPAAWSGLEDVRKTMSKQRP